jgi:hypothetical protein
MPILGLNAIVRRHNRTIFKKAKDTRMAEKRSPLK